METTFVLKFSSQNKYLISGRISRSKTLTSIANQKAIGLKRCTGFLVVDVLHASNLSLPKRRPKLRDPRLLKPFIQIRYSSSSFNIRRNKFLKLLCLGRFIRRAHKNTIQDLWTFPNYELIEFQIRR